MSYSAQLFDSNIIKLAITNPFVALVIGLLATAIFQSSSTTTSIVVALVASKAINLNEAIPIVMGANIGTTITAIITSIGHISEKKEFKKAVSGAYLHHNFKLLTAFILFPLEYYYHYLSKLGSYLTQSLNISSSNGQITSSFFYRYTIDPIIEFISQSFQLSPIIIFVCSILLLFISIRLFIFLLKKSLIGDSKDHLNKYVFDGPFKAFSWGMATTALIHSSTATTSFMVPLIATNKVSLKKAYPFIIGASIGTTFTAIVAALSKSPDAMSIALVHFIFNFTGMLIFLIMPYTNILPLFLAKKIGSFVYKFKYTIFIYVLMLFFLIPFLLIALNK